MQGTNYTLCLSHSSPLQEIDLKAGGGYKVTMGEMIRMMLTKLDWFGTLFPRVPVTAQKVIDERIQEAKQAARWGLSLGRAQIFSVNIFMIAP